MDNLDRVIASNVNNEPVVFRGCTTSEMLGVFAVSCLIVLPVFITAGVMMGNLGLMIGAAMMGILFVSLIGLSLLGGVKRGKPEGYYQHRWSLLSSRYFGGKKQFVDVDGVMGVERDRTTILAKHHLGMRDGQNIMDEDI